MPGTADPAGRGPGAIPAIAPARPVTRPPSWAPGGEGWDTHAHVFGPLDRFPYQERRLYTAPEQPVDAYVRTLDALGLRFGVLVQPSVYGQDNRAMLDAMRRVPGRLLTVVDMDVLSATDAELAGLDDAGVRGLRVRWPAAEPAQALPMVVGRLRELGWHLDAHCRSVEAAADLIGKARELGGALMVEAMGSPSREDDPRSPAFRAMLDLLRDGAAFVKLSHAYQVDPAGPPYEATVALARAIVAAAPTQAVWGSDWPHPMLDGGTIPDDAALLDLLVRWAGDEATARRVLVDNPRRFYRLPPVPVGVSP